MNKLPISAYIIAFNEADRITVPINSVKDWVDEIVVVDSGSSDDTLNVAESLGARVMSNPWPGYGHQKRFAEEQCRNHWLLNIDADEEITPELRDEIMSYFAAGEPKVAGFTFRIRDLLPGEKRLAPMAHTDFRLRLYDFRKGRIEPGKVYDPVELREGTNVLLDAPMLHRSFRSFAHMRQKIASFSDAQAAQLLERGMSMPYLRLITEYPMAFFKSYVLRAYALRGVRGLILSALYAHGRFIRILKYIRLK